MKTLETERLILRNWRESDLDDFFEYAKVEGVGEMAGWPHHETKEMSKNILDLFIKTGDVYAIEYKENHKVIGSVGIHEKDNFPEEYKGKNQREIGYVLSKDYWGRGIMPEAVKKVIEYAFDDMKLDLLWCGHFTINNRSRRVIEKCGFEFYCDGVYKSDSLGKSFEDKLNILTKEKYEKFLK